MNQSKSNDSDFKSINQYDDVVIETTGDHGGDISSQRMDGLDERALRFSMDFDSTPIVVDIGCGLAAQGLRFSLVGSDVTLVDIIDNTDRVEMLNRLYDIIEMDFLQKDIRNVERDEIPNDIDISYSQRFIHYLRFDEAKDVMSFIGDNLASGGRVYLSASGLHSELSNGYGDIELPPEDRYCSLGESMSEKHDIHHDVCLYEECDMRELFDHADLDVVEVYSSDFGNVKGIAEKR